jgi:hypothetical protein
MQLLQETDQYLSSSLLMMIMLFILMVLMHFAPVDGVNVVNDVTVNNVDAGIAGDGG